MFKEHKETLEQNGVDQIFFYFEDSPLTNNIFTTCLLINAKAKRIEARGVSICSLLDTFSRAKGKSKAAGRALKALIRKENSYEINGLGRAEETIMKIIRIKDEDEHIQFLQTQIPALINLQTPVNEVKMQGGRHLKRYKIEMPANYPILKTNELFHYKSEFRPRPVHEMEFKVLEAAKESKA